MSLIRYTSYREIDSSHVIGRVLPLGKEVDYFCPFIWKFLSWSKKLSVKPVYGPHSATYAESGVVQHWYTFETGINSVIYIKVGLLWFLD